MIEPSTGKAADRELPILSLTEKIILLKAIPAFKEIPPDQMREMADSCLVEHFSDREAVFEDGEAGDKLYVVIKGAVTIQKESLEGTPVTLGQMGARQYFGEMALFGGAPRSATARANGDTYLLSLAKGPFYDLGYRFPQIFVEVIKVLSERLRDLSREFVR